MGVLMRRNAIIVFMCIELMLNAVNLLMVAFSKMYGNSDAQIFVFFIMVVAAAEVAVGSGHYRDDVPQSAFGGYQYPEPVETLNKIIRV